MTISPRKYNNLNMYVLKSFKIYEAKLVKLKRDGKIHSCLGTSTLSNQQNKQAEISTNIEELN